MMCLSANLTTMLYSPGAVGKKRTKKERKKTANLGPRIKVLRIVPVEPGQEAEEGSDEKVEDTSDKADVKVECQMETSKQKTVNFEFSTTDIVPEEMANTFIREDLLAEQHRKILVEQLIEIVRQLNENPEKIPTAFPLIEECFSPTREKRDRSVESIARQNEHKCEES